MTPFHRVLTSVLYIVAVLTLIGCASSRTTPDFVGIPEASPPTPWFCQTGEDTEQWDCVRDENLAANPQPTRPPPTEVRGAGEAAPSFERDPRRLIPAPRPEPRPVASPSPEPDVASPANTERPKTSSERAEDSNLPKYIRLAYQPESAVNLLDLPGEFWAVQLAALSSKEGLEAFAREQGVRGMSAAEILSGGKLYYVLLLGIYETREVAVEASSDLDPPFNEPWIRPMHSLQKAMLDAEAFKAQG